MQIDSIRQQMLAIANTREAVGYLFQRNGHADAAVRHVRHQGNAGVTHVQVADGVVAVSNSNGAQAFTAAGGQDVFGSLQTLSDALNANDPNAIQASITGIDASHTQVVAAEVDAGEHSDRLHSPATR